MREGISGCKQKNAEQKPESEITGGGENTVMGGSNLSVKGPDQEVTKMVQEQLKIWKQVQTQQQQQTMKLMLV
jgi:hypothetical protein